MYSIITLLPSFLKEPLPQVPLYGMVNKSGDKVRLTFKLEMDQLWVGTKQRTQKINMSSIRAVVSETIEGHEQFSIVVSLLFISTVENGNKLGLVKYTIDFEILCSKYKIVLSELLKY